MGKWFGGRKKKKKASSMMKAMLAPFLLPVATVIDTTLEGWKIFMIAKLKLADPQKFIGLFSDSVDELRRNITEQIKKALED